MRLRKLCVSSVAMVAITCGSAFSAIVSPTDCDTYAASDLDRERKANGVPFDKINSAVAVPACESAVRKYPNSVRLIYQLGRAYAKKNDFRSAFVQYQKAADQGYVLAEYNLGVLYERGWGVAKDEAQAVAWYRRAAEQGFAQAQSNLGNMYRNGQGVPQDYAEALKWLRKAADQAHAPALINLGVMYVGGQGVSQDYIEAVKFYRKAAEQGDAHAQTGLGSMYGLGQGVPQDYGEAAKWYRLAADQGYANAQALLGLLYEHGNGVPKNIAEAVDWYRKAAAQGFDEARQKLVLLDADAKAGRAAQEAGNAALHKSPLVDTGHAESESLTRVKRCQALNQSIPRSGGFPEWTPQKKQQYDALSCWQRVEADNGAAFQIDLGLIQDFPPGATAPVYSAEGGEFNPMNLKRWFFDCKDHIRVQQDFGLTPWTYAPPRSVAAQIGNIVCAGAGVASRRD